MQLLCFSGIDALVDKGTHGQSLVDLESLTIWLGIVATPLNLGSAKVASTLARGAQQGRIFSDSMRMFATILKVSTISVDGTMLVFGLVNLIQKGENKQLTPLDVVQFSMSVFFFSHTLVQPKTANQIIKKAQEMHFKSMAQQMTDADTKQTFANFLEKNNVDGSIKDRSKIVRSLNRMNDPQLFFKSVGPDQTVDIGGRKGKTMLIGDAKTRINPNMYR